MPNHLPDPRNDINLTFRVMNEKRGQKIYSKSPRWVFCPDASLALANWNRALWESMDAVCPTLFLCQRKEDLEAGASPGVKAFYSPLAPQYHLDAIANAAFVVSAYEEPVRVALAHGVPAFWLRSTDDGQSGLPVVTISKTAANDVFTAIQKALAETPWPTVFASFGAVPVTDARATVPGNLCLTSISDTRYLPFYLGHVENILRTSTAKIRLVLLGLDEKVKPLVEKHFPNDVTVWELKDLWSEAELPRILARGMGPRAFSSKPRLLSRALKENPGPVFHCDSDVWFQTAPQDLLPTLGQGHSVVFPQWNDVFPAARFDGLYNAGMIGVSPGAEPFLEWWSNECYRFCEIDVANGYVADQGYLDFAPVMFAGVEIYRGKDHDVARWNLNTLGITFSEGPTPELVTREGKKVKTFHAAFVDSLGAFELKYCWDQLVTFYSDLPNPDASPSFYENTTVQQSRYWLSLARVRALSAIVRQFQSRLHLTPSGLDLAAWAKGGRRSLLSVIALVRSPLR